MFLYYKGQCAFDKVEIYTNGKYNKSSKNWNKSKFYQ